MELKYKGSKKQWYNELNSILLCCAMLLCAALKCVLLSGGVVLYSVMWCRALYYVLCYIATVMCAVLCTMILPNR